MASVRAFLRAQVDNVYYLYEVVRRINLMLCREGRQGGQQTKDQGKQAHGQAAFGSTNIRPRISMCSAWQNHWQ